VKPLKPYMLKRWRFGSIPQPFSFFTCARPGRNGNQASKAAPVSDDLVHRWILGLPGPRTAIVSLLGRKPDGTSEFSFYSFHGGFDLPTDRPGCLSFQEWLDKWHSSLSIVVREHPTYDFKPVSSETLEAVSTEIRELASAGRTVVLIDSGGLTRTGMVCRHISAVEDSSSRRPNTMQPPSGTGDMVDA
jgi:hypothetical protein